jgi:hypothetical protein
MASQWEHCLGSYALPETIRSYFNSLSSRRVSELSYIQMINFRASHGCARPWTTNVSETLRQCFLTEGRDCLSVYGYRKCGLADVERTRPLEHLGRIVASAPAERRI